MQIELSFVLSRQLLNDRRVEETTSILPAWPWNVECLFESSQQRTRNI